MNLGLIRAQYHAVLTRTPVYDTRYLGAPRKVCFGRNDFPKRISTISQSNHAHVPGAYQAPIQNHNRWPNVLIDNLSPHTDKKREKETAISNIYRRKDIKASQNTTQHEYTKQAKKRRTKARIRINYKAPPETSPAFLCPRQHPSGV